MIKGKVTARCCRIALGSPGEDSSVVREQLCVCCRELDSAANKSWTNQKMSSENSFVNAQSERNTNRSGRRHLLFFNFYIRLIGFFQYFWRVLEGSA